MADSFDDRLDNWARIYRVYAKESVTGSLGRLYKAPWRQWVQLSDIPLFKVTDWRDAELIESHWRKMEGSHKEILKLTYMAKVSKSVLCRRCNIKPWNHAEELRKAKEILEKMVFDGHSVVAFAHCRTAKARIGLIEADSVRPNKAA